MHRLPLRPKRRKKRKLTKLSDSGRFESLRGKPRGLFFGFGRSSGPGRNFFRRARARRVSPAAIRTNSSGPGRNFLRRARARRVSPRSVSDRRGGRPCFRLGLRRQRAEPGANGVVSFTPPNFRPGPENRRIRDFQSERAPNDVSFGRVEWWVTGPPLSVTRSRPTGAMAARAGGPRPGSRQASLPKTSLGLTSRAPLDTP